MSFPVSEPFTMLTIVPGNHYYLLDAWNTDK